MLGALFNTGGEWLSFGLAAWGAALASVLGYQQFVRDRPGVRLRMIPMSVSLEDGGAAELWEVRVVNHRKRPITIRDVGLLRGKDRLHVPLVDQTGATITWDLGAKILADGETVEVYMRRESDVRGAWARDALGRRYTTRYPSRTPAARWRAWRARRGMERYLKEREAMLAQVRALDESACDE